MSVNATRTEKHVGQDIHYINENQLVARPNTNVSQQEGYLEGGPHGRLFKESHYLSKIDDEILLHHGIRVIDHLGEGFFGDVWKAEKIADKGRNRGGKSAFH